MPACLPDWMLDCLADYSLAWMTSIVHRVTTSLIVVKFTARSVTLEEEEVVEDEERAETCLSLFFTCKPWIRLVVPWIVLSLSLVTSLVREFE